MEARGVNRVFCDPFTGCNRINTYVYHLVMWPSDSGFPKSATQPTLSHPIIFHSIGFFGNLGWASPGRYDLVSYIFSTDENASSLAFAGAFVGRTAVSSCAGGGWEKNCCSLVLSASFFFRLHFCFSVICFLHFHCNGFWSCYHTISIHFLFLLWIEGICVFFTMMVDTNPSSLGKIRLSAYFSKPLPIRNSRWNSRNSISLCGLKRLKNSANEEKSDSNVEIAHVKKHDVHQHAATSTLEDALLEEAMKQVKTNTFSLHVNLFPSSNHVSRFFLFHSFRLPFILVDIDITINPGISWFQCAEGRGSRRGTQCREGLEMRQWNPWAEGYTPSS